MKNLSKLVMMSALCLALSTSCSKSKPLAPAAGAEQTDVSDASRAELEQAIADRDQLILLTSDIQQSLNEISELENMAAIDGSELPDQRNQIRARVEGLRLLLDQRRNQIDSLERVLSKSKLYNSGMEKTIKGLRAQVDQQAAEITRLNNELGEARNTIASQSTQIDSLNTTVQNVSGERDAAVRETVDLANELNTCYVCVGSSKELKAHKVLESGFLRKTKIMAGDFDQSFFSKKDKRTLTTLALHSRKAEVLTKQPKGSYVIEDVNGKKVLKITNPEKFWSLTNYLVVKID